MNALINQVYHFLSKFDIPYVNPIISLRNKASVVLIDYALQKLYKSNVIAKIVTRFIKKKKKKHENMNIINEIKCWWY